MASAQFHCLNLVGPSRNALMNFASHTHNATHLCPHKSVITVNSSESEYFSMARVNARIITKLMTTCKYTERRVLLRGNRCDNTSGVCILNVE